MKRAYFPGVPGVSKLHNDECNGECKTGIYQWDSPNGACHSATTKPVLLRCEQCLQSSYQWLWLHTNKLCLSRSIFERALNCGGEIDVLPLWICTHFRWYRCSWRSRTIQPCSIYVCRGIYLWQL